MRLSNLKLENWTCHPSLEIDLSSGLRIEGRNGTGKSSILKAIRFAFSKSAAGYKNKIRNGEREANVELTYIKEGKTYVISRSLHIDKQSQAQLTCGGELVADNPSSVAEALREVLPEEILDNLLYVGQGEITGLIDRLGQKGGRQEFDSLFGLDRLERVYKACGDRIREAKAKTEVYSEQLAKYPENAEKEFSNQLEVLGKEFDGLEGLKSVKCGELARVSDKLKGLEDEIRKLKDVKSKRDALSDELKTLELSLARLANEKASLENEYTRVVEAKKELEQIYKKAESLTKFANIRDLLAARDKVADRLKLVASPEEDLKRIRELEAKVAGKDEAEGKLKIIEDEKAKLNDAFIGAEVELGYQKKYLKDLSGLSGEAKCPRCGQPLIKSHLMNEVVVSESAIRKCEQRIGSVKAKQPEVEKAYSEINKFLEDVRASDFKLKTIKEGIESKKREKDELAGELEAANKKLMEAGYQGEDASVIQRNVDEYLSLKGRIEPYEKTANQEEVIKEKLGKAVKGKTESEKEKAEKTQALNALSFDPSHLEVAETERETALKRRYTLEGEVKELDFKINENKKARKEAEDRKASYLKLVSEKKSEEENQRLLMRAREVFHTDKGLPKYLRDKYIHALNTTLTQYFKRFNENPTYKDVTFTKDYTIQVKTTEGTLDSNQLSGGERVQLAVALRIALIEMLSPIRLLILDEPFGSLDTEHRELLGETLNKMAAGWQLILVTHVHVDSLQLDSIMLEGY